jgi:hypothetical protein
MSEQITTRETADASWKRLFQPGWACLLAQA